MPDHGIEAQHRMSTTERSAPVDRRAARHSLAALQGAAARRFRKRRELEQFGVERRVPDLLGRYGLLAGAVVLAVLLFFMS